MRMKIRFLLLFLIFVTVTVPAGFCSPATVNVNLNTTINSNLMGSGWNVDPLFCVDVNSDPEGEEMFRKMLAYTGQGWMRLVTYGYGWEGNSGSLGNDDSNAWTTPANFSGFPWKQNGDFFLNVTYWLIERLKENNTDLFFSNHWMGGKEWLAEGGDETKSDDHPWSVDEFGENVAAIVYHFRVDRNFPGLKWVAPWNEIGGGVPNYKSPNSNYVGTANPLYRTIHDHLRAYGVTDVTVSGPSSFPNSFADYKEEGFKADNRLVKRILNGTNEPYPSGTWYQGVDDIMNVVAIHEYWTAFDYDAYNNNISGANQGTILSRWLNHVIAHTQASINESTMSGNTQSICSTEFGAKVYDGEDG
jgi:hypothetical protein